MASKYTSVSVPVELIDRAQKLIDSGKRAEYRSVSDLAAKGLAALLDRLESLDRVAGGD